MTPPSHFRRIARDLEKLPCELHESVLVELEFAQLIRLSMFAGPRLRWSLENSLSSWGVFFKKDGMPELSRLLVLTDQVKALCFPLPTKKGEWPHIFKYGSLSFLQHRDSEWRLPYMHRRVPAFPDQASAIQHWLKCLNLIVINTTWVAFHEDYTKLIKPWLDVADADVFSKIPELGKNVPLVGEHQVFSIDDLSKFITTYQRLRRARAEHLASELRDLANIYDAHPDRVKMPFAPQTHRPNKVHVANQLRAEARILIRRAETGRWTDKQTARYRFRFTFPALVPYDWTTQLFNDMWDHKSSTAPTIMQEKCKLITETYPLGLLGLEAFKDLTILTSSNAAQSVDSTTRLCKPVLKETGDDYRPHSKDIKWLQTFTEVIAWMEETSPDKVREVRGDEFWVRASKK